MSGRTLSREEMLAKVRLIRPDSGTPIFDALAAEHPSVKRHLEHARARALENESTGTPTRAKWRILGFVHAATRAIRNS